MPAMPTHRSDSNSNTTPRTTTTHSPSPYPTLRTTAVSADPLHLPSQQPPPTSPTTRLPMRATVSSGRILQTKTMPSPPPLPLPRTLRPLHTNSRSLGEQARSREVLPLMPHLHRPHYLCLLEAHNFPLTIGATGLLGMPPTHQGTTRRAARMLRCPLHQSTTLAMAHSAATDTEVSSPTPFPPLLKFRPTGHLSERILCLHDHCPHHRPTSLTAMST